MAIVNGLLFGLTLAIMIGPIFFTILQTSIEKGFNKAVLVAIGVSLGDIGYILLTYFGLSKLIGFQENKILIGYAGAIILAIFGIVTLLKSRRNINRSTRQGEIRGFFRFFFKGLFINAISPFVPIFWVGTMSLATIEYEYQGTTLITFFCSIISVVFITDLLKAFLAHRLRRLLNDRVIKMLNIVVGVVLLLFSIRMATYYV